MRGAMGSSLSIVLLLLLLLLLLWGDGCEDTGVYGNASGLLFLPRLGKTTLFVLKPVATYGRREAPGSPLGKQLICLVSIYWLGMTMGLLLEQ